MPFIGKSVGTAGIDDNADATAITITNDEKVGIGTAVPASLLELEGADPIITLDDTSAGGYAQVQALNGSLILMADEGGSVNNSIMRFDVDGSERVRINSSGNVGINVTDPDEKLEVAGDVKIGQSADSGVLHFGNTSEQTKIIGRGSSHSIAPDTMTFSTGNTQRMIVDATGQVGIGVNSPTSKLEVGMTGGDVITLRDTNLTASSSDIGNVRVAWDDSAGTRVAYVGTVNSDEFWINNQYSSVVLTYAGSRMFETVSDGAKLHGKLNITDSQYDNHLELNRSSEQWRFSPSTDGSLDIRRLTGTGTAYLDVLNLLRVTPTEGSVTIGPQNSGFCHFSTDRPKHYFNKPVHIDGGAVDYDTGDHFLLPNANNSELPNLATAVSGGAINYIYNRGSNVTLTRGDFSHHIIQQWSGTATFTITSSTFLQGDVLEFVNVKGAVTITVVGTRIYLPSGSYDTTLTLSQAGKFRLLKYSTSNGYWMVG